MASEFLAVLVMSTCFSNRADVCAATTEAYYWQYDLHVIGNSIENSVNKELPEFVRSSGIVLSAILQQKVSMNVTF